MRAARGNMLRDGPVRLQVPLLFHWSMRPPAP